jgi:hypothetical protein
VAVGGEFAAALLTRHDNQWLAGARVPGCP